MDYGSCLDRKLRECDLREVLKAGAGRQVVVAQALLKSVPEYFPIAVEANLSSH